MNKYILVVEYRRTVNDKYDYYKEHFEYNGCTNKFKAQWITDCEKVAFDNCKPNEAVMGYDLIDREQYLLNQAITNLIDIKERHYRGYLSDEQYIEEVDNAISNYINKHNE